MTWQMFFEIIGVLAIIGGMFKWIWSRIDKKFDVMEKRFESIDKRFELVFQRFDLVDQKFDKVFSVLNQQGQRLSRIEGYLEGRDVRIVNTGTGKDV